MFNKEIRLVLTEKKEKGVFLLKEDGYGQPSHIGSKFSNIEEILEVISNNITKKKKEHKVRYFLNKHMVNKRIIKIIEANGFVVRPYGVVNGFTVELTKFDNPCNTKKCKHNKFKACQNKNVDISCKDYTHI